MTEKTQKTIKDFYSTSEAAKILGVTDPATVRQRILRGKLKAVKFGRDWLIPSEELERVR